MPNKRVLTLVVVALVAAMLVTGIATSNIGNGNEINGNVPNGNVPNGDVPNGDEPNGEEPNGDEPNGEEPNGYEPTEPDLISGLGVVINCDDQRIGDEFVAGTPAIDFRFEDANGRAFALSDLRGKLVMLNFWATWCGFCKSELPHIQQVYNEWPSTELVVLAIDKGENYDTVAAFMQEGEYSFPVVLDSGQLVSAHYGVSGIPTTFFIDEYGLMQVRQIGYFHNVAEIENILDQLIGQ